VATQLGMSRSMQVNRRRAYPVISGASVYPVIGRLCPRQSIRLRCIPCCHARHCRAISYECRARLGFLWEMCVTLTWTTHETYTEISPSYPYSW